MDDNQQRSVTSNQRPTASDHTELPATSDQQPATNDHTELPAASDLFDAEMLQFLDRPLLMRLATLGTDGYPQVTPVWYVYEQGRLFASTEKERIKYRNILRDPRVGASIDDDHPYRGISIKGVAHVHEEDIEPRVRQIVTRYAPAHELDALVAWLFKGQRVVIEIEPVSVVKIGAEWHNM